MDPAQHIVTKTIRIRIVEHRDSGLLVALSEDLKGLMVPGRSDNEIAKKLPDAVREILEAEGNKVISVTADTNDNHLPPIFMARDFIANAQIEAVH